MQKTIVNINGNKVGVYYPITGKLLIEGSLKPMKLDKQAFNDYCVDMAWSIL
jgi:hypothetical protein